jgi:L-2,4-diaminobutyrate decarboxylase
MSSVPSSITDAYDPERFRRDGHALIDMLADALARAHDRQGPVLPWRAPEAALAEWGAAPLTKGSGELVADLANFVARSTALHHPRYMAHQVAPPLPGAVLAETVAAFVNNGMAVYEMGPASTPIELAVIELLRARMGLPAGAGGVLTSGGSVGNLTALLAMRQARAGFDVWRVGAHAGPPLAVITSNESHYSVARAMGIMGWGDDGVIVAPVDARHRMTAAAVKEALQRAGDRRVIGIVAAAGSTATGAFDPLQELADLAEREQLWLHVDAAHGGGVAMSPTHRGLLAGIERADSIVWDAHKLMMMPALVTAVLFKQGHHAYEAFAQRASYLFAEARPESHWWDLGTRTLECTKRAMAVELWTALRVHGEEWFGAVIDRQVALSRAFAAKIAAAPDFELAVEPDLNIVCFRHRTADNRELQQRVVEDGRFYVVGTKLDDAYYLRATIMNPLTEESDFDHLLEHLRSLCR